MSSIWREKTVGVLMGGVSAEREISLRTGAAVCDAFGELGYQVRAIEVEERGGWMATVRQVDVVFIALHGNKKTKYMGDYG
jgi:D-alanine-D-alanine ligase